MDTFSSTTIPDQIGSGAAVGTLLVLFAIGVALFAVLVAGMWKVFQKAGEPGWAAIVPGYNVYILVKIAGRPPWWTALLLLSGFIPLVGGLVTLVLYSLVVVDITKKFNKDTGFGVGLGLLPFVFYPILGFGSATYGFSRSDNPDYSNWQYSNGEYTSPTGQFNPQAPTGPQYGNQPPTGPQYGYQPQAGPSGAYGGPQYGAHPAAPPAPGGFSGYGGAELGATSTPAPSQAPAAGWFPDPSGQASMRYWDGHAWTAHTS